MCRFTQLIAATALFCLTASCGSDAVLSPAAGALPPNAASSQGQGQGPRASEQVVFSGVASSSTFPGPVGFWIWCEAESDNPYDDECNGAMYFYALSITRHVEGEVVELGADTEVYQMTVSSTRDGAILDCVLTNPNGEPNHGPTNTVTVSCTQPGGTATSTNAVVNVTGP